MARRALMPLHDNPDSERLVEWMNEVPHYSLNDQKPSDWTPFQGCAYCTGLCSVLESADAVRQLLNGQRVPIFQGQYEELLWLAMRGFKFAKYLMSYLNDFKMKDYRLHEPLDLGFWRIDQRGLSRVRLVSLVQGTEDGNILPWYIALATAPNDPANTVTSRLPDADPTSPHNLMLLKHWLHCCASCQSGHERCRDLMPFRTELPTRVVYVGTNDGQDPPRLHSSNGERAGYVALSYCWGGPQRYQTERDKIERYMHALPVEGLPKSLQDAILLTRALGIQYIWIDSLCIIQDCDEDKDREMARMANIYKNTVFTISAARAKSCDEGFLGLQDKRVSLLQISIKLPMNCLNGTVGSVLFYPSRKQVRGGDTPIDKRAWTYQEKLLSRRMINFLDDAIEWICPSREMSDDQLGTKELGVTDPAYLSLRKSSGGLSNGSRLLYLVSEYGHLVPENLRYFPIYWWMAVYEYTRGSLSNLEDKLPAIAGVASEFHNLNGDIYIAGLWMSHLIRDLQWQSGKSLEESSNNTGSKDLKYDAPTWTWASVHECVIIGANNKKYGLDSDRVKIIDCKVNLVSPSAPFGSVNGGELRLRAPLKFLSYRRIQEMLALVDGDGEFIGRIFLDRRSRYHADELTTLRGGAAPHIESTGVWFLGLSKHADLNYESSGLALAKRADGLFERIGKFQIDEDHSQFRVRTAEQDQLRASWGDDYVVTDVTIV